MKIKEAKKLVQEVVRERLGYIPGEVGKNTQETNLGKLRRELLAEISIIQELSLEQLKQQWVESGKMTQEVFDQIIQQVSKPAFVAWLIKNVSDKAIKEEDIYKWGGYIRYFDKFQKNFPKHDINSYKGRAGVEELQTLITAHQTERVAIKKASGVEGEEEIGKNLVSPQGIKKLTSVGIKFLGSVDGYQVFEVPKSANSREAHKMYSTILGRCANQSDGNQIQLCTVASYEAYSRYLDKGNLYVFFNLQDPVSPYQFHYEEGQFMDKNDTSII